MISEETMKSYHVSAKALAQDGSETAEFYLDVLRITHVMCNESRLIMNERGFDSDQMRQILIQGLIMSNRILSEERPSKFHEECVKAQNLFDRKKKDRS